MKRNFLTLTVAFILIVVCVLLLFVFQVRKSETAVVARFGKIDRVETEAGPHLRFPWPMEMVYTLDGRIQNFEGRFDQSKLPDQNMIMLGVDVGYKIDNAMEFFPKFLNGSIPEAEKHLADLVHSAKNEVVGRHNFPDFVSTDPNQMKFAQIESEILDRVTKQVQGEHCGIEMKFIRIRKIGLPESVTQNVLDRMTSERQYYINQLNVQGTEEASKIKSKADSEAYVLVSDANAKAYNIKADGEAQMMRSLQVLQQNPTLAKFNLEMDALGPFLRKSTLVLDQTSSPLQWLQQVPTNAAGPLPSDLTPVSKAP